MSVPVCTLNSVSGPNAAGMSDYERRAWEELLGQAAKDSRTPNRASTFAQNAKSGVKQATTAAFGAVKRVPGADKALDFMDAAMQKAMDGLHHALVERGLNSVTPAAIFKSFADEGVAVGSYDKIREFDLRICDRTMPRRKERYVALAASQGAVTSLAVTGATVSSTVSGGTTLGVAAAAISADVTAVMVGMGRIIALVGAHYGYDVREPEEQVFASGVLAYSTASNSAEKAASLAALSRLTQQMMRRATWNQLRQNQLVNVIHRVVTMLGFNLTKKKLAQAVPVAGVLINGGLNARMAQKTFERAQQAYRLRFLTEKYDLDASLWSIDVVDAEVIDIPMVDEIIDAELANDTDSRNTENA